MHPVKKSPIKLAKLDAKSTKECYVCDTDCLVQPPNSRIAPRAIGEGASSLFGGWPGSPENVVLL